MSAQLVRHDLAGLSSIRVTGTLTDDAQLLTTTGHEPHRLLVLAFEPKQGLPYLARMDIGADVADQMATEAELPRMRRGALISVGGDALRLVRDHGREHLAVINPHYLVIPQEPVTCWPTPGSSCVTTPTRCTPSGTR